MGGVVGIRRWTPELPLRYLPHRIKDFYVAEAKHLQAELKEFHHEPNKQFELSPSGSRVESASLSHDGKNSAWYRQLCAMHPKTWSKASYNMNCTNFHRIGTVKALDRLITGQDDEFFSYGKINTRFRYDELLRKLIHIRLLCGSYSEGFDQMQGYNSPEEVVREFFGNPQVVTPKFVPQGTKHIGAMDLEETLRRLGVPTKDDYYNNVQELNVDLLRKLQAAPTFAVLPLLITSTSSNISDTSRDNQSGNNSYVVPLDVHISDAYLPDDFVPTRMHDGTCDGTYDDIPF